jgi:hypothetical protein
LGIYLKEYKYKRTTCTPIVIVAISTISKLWIQPRCTTTNEWIKKMWYIYTMEYYSNKKKNKILLFAGKWVELEFILGKINQTQKAKYCISSIIHGI